MQNEKRIGRRILVYDVETVEELFSLAKVEAALSKQLSQVVRKRDRLLERLQWRAVIQGKRKAG